MLVGLTVLFFHVVVAPVAVVHALLFKRDYRSALGWIGVSLLFPVAGPLLYFFFGVNRLRQRARQLTGSGERAAFFGYVSSSAKAPKDASAEGGHELAIVGRNTAGVPLQAGNRVELLRNGDAMFPQLVEAIRGAERYAWISSYIFSGDGVGGEIADALAAAAKRGVDARVLIDGIGAFYTGRSLRRKLKGTKVKFAEFLPPRLLPPSLYINMRNHRKIAVIDHETAFFGGLNIDDRHFVESPRVKSPHEDVHFRMYGRSVESFATLLARDWYTATRERLEIRGETRDAGDVHMRVIDGGPDESLYRLSMTLLGAASAAKKRIRIMTPYFLPQREMTGVLQAAAVRGVQVEIMIPEKSNLRYVDWASRHQLWEFLKWGVHVRLEPPPFAHSKLFLVDDDYVLGGSANIDPRSLRLNFEIGVEMFDVNLAKQVHAYFDESWQAARPLSLKDVDTRSLPARLRDGFFWLFSGYL